jgi:hypothetical protein
MRSLKTRSGVVMISPSALTALATLRVTAELFPFRPVSIPRWLSFRPANDRLWVELGDSIGIAKMTGIVADRRRPR